MTNLNPPKKIIVVVSILLLIIIGGAVLLFHELERTPKDQILDNEII